MELGLAISLDTYFHQSVFLFTTVKTDDFTLHYLPIDNRQQIDRHAVATFSKSRVWEKVPEESTGVFEIHELP